jgi:hypothetical protein
MKIIYYNSAVAKRCGKNGVIKAVLLNYIYNYHTLNIRKRAGHAASISLAEFVYQYKVGDADGLWKRSFIHKILRDLKTDGHLTTSLINNRPTYSVSSEIAGLLTDTKKKKISFALEEAVQHGIHVAVMQRYLQYVIKESPNGVAYNLSVKKMSEESCISPAQIYRAIEWLVTNEIVSRSESPVRRHSRALCLASFVSKVGNHKTIVK